MKWYFTGQWTDHAGRPVKVAPIQITPSDRAIPLEVAAEAWKEYDAQGHGSQSLDRLCERGGFSASELAILLFERIKRIERTAQETPAVPCAKCAGTRVVYGHNYNGDQYQVPCPDCSTANR